LNAASSVWSTKASANDEIARRFRRSPEMSPRLIVLAGLARSERAASAGVDGSLQAGKICHDEA
jgi:hypothetical protein